jgi:tetratricopeptide (TPR) repeat protein
MSAGPTAQATGSGNIIVQAVGDGIQINFGLPHLMLIPPRNRAPQIRTEIDLLNPYGRAIGLVGRDADMQSLWDWLHSNRPISVRTLTGRAGAGKTRAAIELVEKLNQEKPGEWWGGFLQGREMRRFASQQNLADWNWARPTLIVVDYAASLVEPLREWLRDLAQNSGRAGGKPLRLLLLEREAAAGEGWLQLLLQGGYSEAGVPELFDPLEPRRLDRLDTAEKRRAVLAKMLEVAAPLVQCQPPKLPAAGENPRIDKQLENAVWEDPLYLMMAALLSLRSELVEVLELAGTELAMRLVDHEIKRLTEGATSIDAERLPVHLAAFTALGNGLTHEQALEVAEEESAALKLTYPGGAGELVRRVHELLPAPDLGLAPVVPDVLAEALVIRALSQRQCSKAQQEAAVLRAVKKLGRRVVPFIVRTVQDFAPTGRKEPLNWLENLIKSGKADDLGLLVEIDGAMPMQTVILREKALEVNEMLVKRLAKLSRKNSNENILGEQARLLNNLANRLKAVGRREEALNTAQEALRINQQLAKARPDVFLPNLATSLNTLGNRLSDLGRREEALDKAQEALRIRDLLAKSRPEAFRFDFASSLNNLATMLSALGRREEALDKALEAVRIYEQLATGQPEKVLPELGRALHNLANRMSDLGRREEALDKAQQAERIFEQLAKARPDAFLADLASSLNGLAVLLSDMGRIEEGVVKGQESLRIQEELAKAQPDSFLPELARSLSTLTDKLRILGRHEEALVKGQHAVRIGEQLAKVRPGAFEPGLAGSLNNLAGVLSELGRRGEALAKAQEAARIYAQLAKARPDAFLPNLATSLSNLAAMLSKLGRCDEALEKAQEAVRIREQLARARPDAFLPNLATSLNNLANTLSALGRHEEALEKAQEAVRIQEQLARARPDAFLRYLATFYGAKGAILRSMERHAEAAAAFAQGIRAITPLFQKVPNAFAQLIGSLFNEYLRAIQQAEIEPDKNLLAPVVEVFEKLKQNQPKE